MTAPGDPIPGAARAGAEADGREAAPADAPAAEVVPASAAAPAGVASPGADAPAPVHPRSPLHAFAGILTGFVLIALTNAIAIAATVPWPAGGIRVRLLHHAFDLAQIAGLGVVVATLVGAGALMTNRSLAASLIGYAAAAAAVMHAIVGLDLRRQALVALNGSYFALIYWTFVVLCGMALPAAHLLGAFFRRFRRLFVLPLVIAAGGVITHHAVLRDDYPGLHGAIAWTAATLAGTTLAPRVLDRARRWSARRGARIAAAAFAVVAVAGLVVAPPNRVRVELFREPGAVGAWLLAATSWSTPRLAIDAPPPDSPWFRDRSGLPPVPPTSPRILAGNPVVVMVTIDATRADVIDDPANEKLFPVISGLRRTGASFVRATSPGSQTAVSLTTTFSGRYFSELYWSLHGVGASRFVYAADDPSPRFPALLAESGVVTASFCSLNFLAGDFGVIRGFAEEKVIPEGRKHAYAKQMVDPVLERLRKVGNEPFFLYVHLMEPHAPYDRGAKKGGTDEERYLSEISLADAELGRITRMLQLRFKGRGIVIVGSDHGEAFGEHGTVNHTKTLYEELLRVPLIVNGPGIVPRRIEEPVGMVDLGPTILDLFGVETPAAFKGQSLVPLLAGRNVTLERPLLAEGRLRKAIYWDGLKVIQDERRKLVEVYDLGADPGELVNLFDARPERVAPAVAALRAFFDAHALVAPGYSPPFKP